MADYMTFSIRLSRTTDRPRARHVPVPCCSPPSFHVTACTVQEWLLPSVGPLARWVLHCAVHLECKNLRTRIKHRDVCIYLLVVGDDHWYVCRYPTPIDDAFFSNFKTRAGGEWGE